MLKLVKSGDISEEFYQKTRSVGGQPARIYGLAKVHKVGVPLRPIVSMPGSVYDRLGQALAQLVSKLPQAQIACDTKRVANRLRKTELDENEQFVSLDVSSLFTNVPLRETVKLAVELLHQSGALDGHFSKETAEHLMLLACENVHILTPEGYYRQKDGVAMGSPLGPFLANIFMSQFDSVLEDKSAGTFYERYVDDILLSLKLECLHDLLNCANALHPNLRFTTEAEENGCISFLDLKVTRQNRSLKVSWFRKKTDTNVILNFYSLSPMQYKQSVIRGTVHRLLHITSTWNEFDQDLKTAKQIFEANQFPPSVYNPLIRDSINRTLSPPPITQKEERKSGASTSFFTQYRGHVSDWLKSKLKSIEDIGKVNVIFTTRKLRTILPSLKCPVPMKHKSNVVYRITCPGCEAQYIGQTQRHLQKRCSEHASLTTPVGSHLQCCIGSVDILKHVKVIDQARSVQKLLTLEAIHISKLKPSLNTREEFRQRFLALRF